MLTVALLEGAGLLLLAPMLGLLGMKGAAAVGQAKPLSVLYKFGVGTSLSEVCCFCTWC
jgi:hypothetical protein